MRVQQVPLLAEAAVFAGVQVTVEVGSAFPPDPCRLVMIRQLRAVCEVSLTSVDGHPQPLIVSAGVYVVALLVGVEAAGSEKM